MVVLAQEHKARTHALTKPALAIFCCSRGML